MSVPSLRIHEAGLGYIGRLAVPRGFAASTEGNTPTQAPQTFFILDRSGSMGQNVARLANIVIPALARDYLKLTNDDLFTLITFDSKTETFVGTISTFERADIKSRGVTNMAGVFGALLSSVNHDNPNIRIIAISDGCIGDTDQTLAAASSASNTLKTKFNVSAIGIRLFTSYSQPDTRALASILQLNTSNPGSLIDLQASASQLDALIAAIGCELGASSGPVLQLEANGPCLLSVPWATASTSMSLRGGNDNGSSTTSTVWLASPPEALTLNGVEVGIEHGPAMTHDTMSLLLEDKISYFLDQLRVLKVLNSPDSKEELNRIVSYFRDLEAALPPPSDLAHLLSDGSLAGRSKYMKASLARRIKSVVNTMESIANDERINNLNLAQQADYLRQAGTGKSRTTRGLARRAEASGMDFEATMRAEVIAMSAHIDALKDVDDTEHAISFYSQATTLEGIKCMADLAKDPETLNHLTAPQMLRLFNVVGLPAVGPVGDFPDPMTYRLEKILYGSHISVADITVALDMGGKLYAPGRKDEEIVTAVPVFDDRRVQKFLQKHARASLEYICSIGMRRMIAEVPKTYPYTICSGIWKMVEELDKEKTELRIQLFNQLVFTYENSIVGLYEHILKHLGTNQDPAMSFYLGHNGITNLIAPILHLVREGSTQHMPRILRALYSFESYQVMRRKTRDGGQDARQAALDAILGVDFKSDRATPLPPRFTRSEPIHCSEPAVNESELAKFTKDLWFVPYATLLEPYFRAVSSGDDYVAAMQAVPTMTGSTVSAALGLPASVSLEEFLLYNVVEGLIHGEKSARIDKETNKPKLPDLGNPGAGSKMVREYIAKRYEDDYSYRLKQQLGEEQRALQDELIEDLAATPDVDAFCSLLKAGNTRGDISVVIDRDNAAGFLRLHEMLMNRDAIVQERVAKLYVIYSGMSPAGEPVFNGGNLYRTDWKPLKALLLALGQKATWESLEREMSERGHSYRGGAEVANRHGHSNDKPSYYAFGCGTLEEYRAMASESSWGEYALLHANCCGVPELLAREGLNVMTQ